MKYGFLFDDAQEAMELVQAIDQRVEQLKAKIRAENLDKEKFRHVFTRLLASRRKIIRVTGYLLERTT